MSEGNAQSVIAPIDGDLADLYRRVATDHTRIEVELPDGDGQCVIISKDELQGLERALEILADGEGMKAACDSLNRLCELWRQQIEQQSNGSGVPQ